MVRVSSDEPNPQMWETKTVLRSNEQRALERYLNTDIIEAALECSYKTHGVDVD